MSGYYLKTEEKNPFDIGDKLKLLHFRYKMYLNIVRKKERQRTQQPTNRTRTQGLAQVWHIIT